MTSAAIREQDGGGMRGLVAAIGSIAGVGLGFSITLPLLALTLEDRGISSTWIGINTAFWGLSSLAITPFVSRIAARLGTAQALALSILALAAALPLFYLSPFWLWFPLRLVAGAALTTTFVLSEFWINVAAPPGKRGVVMGIYATVLSIGFAMGPVILYFTGTHGMVPFVVGAAVLAVGTLPVLSALGVAPKLTDGHRTSFVRFLFLAPVATGAALLFGAIESGAFSLLPLYGQRVGHARDVVIMLGIGVTIGNILLQMPMGLLSDRIDRRKLLFAIASFGLLGAGLLPVVSADFWPFMLALTIWGGVVGSLYTVGLAHLGSRFTGEDLAAANAAFIFCYSLGGLVGPATIGAAMDAYDPQGFAVAVACFFAAYLVLVVTRMRHAQGR
ncbi:MFS family permease [Kaistia hirudinis]|uniref:MFS family permease n=1 Tax=Kaistia hirudinis TaxID=1293440 RepID=A0A840AUK5_9HYPH|nr:MFS transporter [Kaistia hirudinis]MBB3933294.1 MFS family permease [Kaistia hirudinis]MBN9019745.1 MFS transporter [Hyphomicrobiales bacterium]